MRIALFASLFVTSLSLHAGAQTSEGRYIKDGLHHCKVWSDHYTPEDSVTWSGSCKSGYAEGKGQLNWFSQQQVVATYTGDMKKGWPEGMGQYTIAGYGTLEGQFVKGNLHGKGRMRLENGGQMEGNFVNGNFLDLDDPYLVRLQKVKVNIPDSTTLYLFDKEAGSLFYYCLPPAVTTKAALVLFPSTGESAENVISANKQLIQQAYGEHILVMVMSINYNKSLESDPAAFAYINQALTHAAQQYHIPTANFILAGLSLGGENSLQYTEMSRNPAFTTSIRPLAVIGVDPPVDMADLYTRAQEEIAIYTRDTTQLTPGRWAALNEDRFIINYFNQVYGGSPLQARERYIAGSSFTLHHQEGGNARYLLDVPVRIYCDPDINWQMEQRSRDYYHMNAASLSAMVNFLQINGNTRAQFISALGKGYRVDGQRHPHSWSIVDPQECLVWIKSLLPE
jgi:hypothetical protein